MVAHECQSENSGVLDEYLLLWSGVSSKFGSQAMCTISKRNLIFSNEINISRNIKLLMQYKKSRRITIGVVNVLNSSHNNASISGNLSRIYDSRFNSDITAIHEIDGKGERDTRTNSGCL